MKTKSYNKIIMLVFVYILCVLGLIFMLTDKTDFRIGTTIMGIITIIFMKPLGKIVYRFTFTKVFNKEADNYLFEEYLFIVLSNKKHLVISLSAFNNIKQQDVFKNLLEEKTGIKVKNLYPKKLVYM